MITVPKDLYFYVGEKPPATPCRYEDDNGTLLTDLDGKTLVAKVRIDGGTEGTVACSAVSGGEFTINWDTTTSDFTAEGIMAIDINVQDSPRDWYLDRVSVPVKTR